MDLTRVNIRKPTSASAGKRTRRKKVNFAHLHPHALLQRIRNYRPSNLLSSAEAGGGGSGSSDDEGVPGDTKADAIAKVEAFKGKQNITVQEVEL